ncbi:SDR family oxidoreductase [Pseudomonas sp. H9]|uniref:SDR family NAD(P)-dependent oxidoreductase n=1 Tax=Pseudomonas sp. H9 TaxID=483968 RepID=UPI00140430B0|nr:SDR family NAD(P)-dependent oxidoreductase [Pseudomonas sp. H9]
MNIFTAKRIWITGASSGLGLAFVEQLLEQGALVTASGRNCDALLSLYQQYHPRLKVLDGDLTDPLQAVEAARQVTEHWGAIDYLIINAGACDYLPSDSSASAVFEGIARTNLSISRNCLETAIPLLQRGSSPQVLAVLSRYSSLQLFKPNQPETADNSLMKLFEYQRATLATDAIDLTIVAPQRLNDPLVQETVILEYWSAHTAAEVILDHLPARPPHLLLEAMHLNLLWPLPS